MNLNELHIPDDADTACDWAVRREFGLRWDAYHGGVVREVGLAEAQATAQRLLAPWLCKDPEAQWIADQQHSVHWERCVP